MPMRRPKTFDISALAPIVLRRRPFGHHIPRCRPRRDAHACIGGSRLSDGLDGRSGFGATQRLGPAQTAANSSARKARDLGTVDAGGDEALPDAARQDEGERAVADLLVLGHGLHQGLGVAAAARNRLEPVGRPARARWLATRPASWPDRGRGGRRSGRPGPARSPPPRRGRGGRSRRPSGVSRAWAKVWPRLSRARSPSSRSSRTTTAGLGAAADRHGLVALGPPAKMPAQCASHQSRRRRR